MARSDVLQREKSSDAHEVAAGLESAVAGDPVRAVLVTGLDPFTKRDLIVKPPKDNETMQGLGIGATNLDRFVRPWINRRFRKALGKPYLLSGDIKADAKFSTVLALCQ